MPKGIYTKKKIPAEKRFWPKVEKTESCWNWKAWKTMQGYGQFWDGDKYTTAHRFSYEQENGPAATMNEDEKMNTMKTYAINLCNGTTETVKAEIVTYDQVGNLIFMNTKKTLQTHENPDGTALELVKCYNSRHYVSYGHAPMQH